jgi:hypothetical protein
MVSRGSIVRILEKNHWFNQIGTVAVVDQSGNSLSCSCSFENVLQWYEYK